LSGTNVKAPGVGPAIRTPDSTWFLVFIQLLNIFKFMFSGKADSAGLPGIILIYGAERLRNFLNFTNLFNMLFNGRKTEVRRRKKPQSKITILRIFLIFAFLLPALSPAEVPIALSEFIKIQF